MMEENKRIFIISKIDDYLLRFWKVELKADEELDLDFYQELLRFIHVRKIERLRNFIMYDEINAGFEFWTMDKYKNLYNPDVRNVDGLPWPRMFNLYPMANIRTEKDLEEYNKWRATVFKDQVRCVKHFKWDYPNGVIDQRIKESWMRIDPDRDIHPLDPPLLEVAPSVINYIYRMRLNRAKEYGNS